MAKDFDNGNQNSISNESSKSGQEGSPTAYDDAFRTLQTDCPRLMLPVINEIFGSRYDGDEPVLVYANELFPEGIEKPGAKIISDSNMTIVGRGIKKRFPLTIKSLKEIDSLLSGGNAEGYQIECESNPHDGTIWIRLYKYGATIAVHTAVTNGNVTDVYFPDSALIYLRSGSNTADSHTLRIHAGEKILEIEIPTLKISDYSLDEMFEKKLFFLLPFYIFNREDDFQRCMDDETELKRLKSEYEEIKSRLEKCEQDGTITFFEKASIIKMTLGVIAKISDGNEPVKRGLEEIMGGKVLEYEAKAIFREGMTKGEEEGEAKGAEKQAKATALNLYNKKMDLDFIADAVGQTPDIIIKWLGIKPDT